MSAAEARRCEGDSINACLVFGCCNDGSFTILLASSGEGLDELTAASSARLTPMGNVASFIIEDHLSGWLLSVRWAEYDLYG